MESQPPSDQPPGIAIFTFDNSGRAPLLIPGAGMPLYVEAAHPADGHGRFAHAYDSSDYWPMRATAREIAMLRCMEKMTDKSNWQHDVFSDEIVSVWKDEAKKADWKISNKAWAWCVAELRDKARRFVDTGRTIVLDYGWGAVCKVDLGEELPELLKKAVDEVVEREPRKGRPHPDGVAHIVDPHLAPLVYDQTRVLVGGGAVGREDMDDWYGRGVPLGRPKYERRYTESQPLDSVDKDALERRRSVLGTLWPGFQWLPCEVALNPGVQITSYINDLHPHEQADAYPAMEMAVSVAIESWNDVLARVDPNQIWRRELCTGRTPARIRTFGVQFPFGLPAWEEQFSAAVRDEDSEAKAKVVASLQSLEDEVSRGEVGSRAQISGGARQFWIAVYAEARHLVHPEPGVSFSYQEWKEGRNVTRAIVPPPYQEPDVDEPKVHQAYSVSLPDEFGHSGLQVVVQINSIELTPTKPRFDDLDRFGDEMWHVADSLVTDYIAATSILFFEFDNVQPVGVRFRQPVHLRRWEFTEAEHGDFNAIMEVFDLDWSNYMSYLCQPTAFPSVQEMGQVMATEGRMLSFPGPVAYHFQPWQLADASRPGRARYLVVHLVDPNYRVCSTRNVPPQRLDWWAYDVARKAPRALNRLPTELFDEIVAGAADAEGMLDAQGMGRVRDAMEEERRDNAENVDFHDIGFHQFCDDPDDVLCED
ncbi:hypothetical protein B0T18DRAFT_395420 [Schizothecium vesticola]|uniref:Uncharacterized protein n=1 Tax=Schizothecium vesticola TaxID=314040 RepID=A0AA40KBE1_9PEZI|nr:hypothetical protein B0T18DRAFT_395420 [Schizothecium vesticola]